MPTYALLATLTRPGAEDIKGIVERRSQNLQELADRGIKIIADYALMGEYDFLYIVEAPDNITLLREVARGSADGTLQFRSMPAVPMEEFVELVRNM